MFNFEIKYEKEKKNYDSRTGLITTPHGEIKTPAFIFCATKAKIKDVTVDELIKCKTQIILSNTFHLEIFPGSELIKQKGGLHTYSDWPGPMLTDSGGYQIFSMGYGSVSSEIKGKKTSDNSCLLKITEEGALFKSYYDNSIKLFSPEISMQIQKNLGPDLVVVFDECTPFNIDKKDTKLSLERSHNWANRSISEFYNLKMNENQALYGIIQGGIYQDLRSESIKFNFNLDNQKNYFGIAIGGSLGDDKQTMYLLLEFIMKKIKKYEINKPIHLLGIGGISDIFFGVKIGIDTFDCVHPTRIARHGCALVKAKHWHNRKSDTPSEYIDLTKSKFKDDDTVIDSECKCPTCSNGITRKKLRELFKAKELIAGKHVSLHNIYFMNTLMEEIREGISKDNLDHVQSIWLNPSLYPENRNGMNMNKN
ncbi:Queuine tRNA-ribosyltransferase [seawater metagenome]|uniref:Queuine tRNA-ribosyltransferase n=1 Tax=seawater metagenome TaxID=1561972 RepID=A0A5E8CI27_9ZZZZ